MERGEGSREALEAAGWWKASLWRLFLWNRDDLGDLPLFIMFFSKIMIKSEASKGFAGKPIAGFTC